MIRKPENWKYEIGDLVCKKTRGGKGAQFRGRVVGFYTTQLTDEGYVIESSFEGGTVQISPERMIQPWGGR